MTKMIWLIIISALAAGCMADNGTIQAINQMTVGDVLHRLGFEDTSIQSPPPRPIAPVSPPGGYHIDGY